MRRAISPWRSLSTRLVVAFLITSVAGMLLAALFIRESVTRQFDDYLSERLRDDYIADVTAYYNTHQTLVGISDMTPAPGDRPPPDTGPVDSQQADRARNRPRWPIGLASTDGVVLVPYVGHSLSDTLALESLNAGVPIAIGGRTIGVVVQAEASAFRNPAEERYLQRTNTALAVSGLVMIGVALALGIVLARLITRPVYELTAAAGRIADGDLAQRVPVRSDDEIGLLASQFNKMSADLVQATQLRKRMTADIAHDLRTPLTVISGYMEALRDQVLKPTPDRFAMMHDEIQLLRRLVEDLHTLTLADAGELNLNRGLLAPQLLLGRVADIYQHAAAQQGVTLRVEVAEGVPDITVDADHMLRALSNLVSNALRYTPQGGRITLSAQCVSGHIEITVADTGSGIAQEHLSSIFERSYRADGSRQTDTGGSGLGLAIVKSIVIAHGGHVRAESVIGQGSVFTIELPDAPL